MYATGLWKNFILNCERQTDHNPCLLFHLPKKERYGPAGLLFAENIVTTD